MKYWWGLFLGLIVIAALSYGFTFTGQGGTLTSEYMFIAKGLLLGNDPKLGDDTFVGTNGSFTPRDSTRSMFIADLEGTVQPGNDCTSNCQSWGVILDPQFSTNNVNNSYQAVIGGYPTYTITAGETLQHAVFLVASYADYQNAGTVDNFEGILIDFQGIADAANQPTKTWGIHTLGGDQAGGNVRSLQNNLAGRTIIGSESTSVTDAPLPSMVFEPVTFANLTAAPNGTIAYCGDCNATCAAGGGTGKFCKREAGAWAAF